MNVRIRQNKWFLFAEKIAYIILTAIYNKNGMPIKINNYKFRFVPRYFRYYARNYENNNLRFIVKYIRNGMQCMDVGAHFGYYSMLLSKHFGCTVYSFEPTPYSVGILKRHIQLNNLEEKVHVEQKAISNKEGRAILYVQDTAGAVSNSVVDYHHSNENKTPTEVVTTTIDRVCEKRYIDFIKIDTEGVEFDVLQGAIATIRRCRPVILLALHPLALETKGDSLERIWSLIRNNDYLIYKDIDIEWTEDAFCRNTNLFDVFLMPIQKISGI